MNTVHDRHRTALLSLLRAGLWNREIDDNSCFPLSPGDWDIVFLLSRHQTVTGIVFQGLQYLPDEMMPPEGLLIRWTAEVDGIERKNVAMNRSLAKLYALLSSNGINPVLQKGQGVARLYDNPLLRECGDIDLYFDNAEALDKAVAYMRRCNINVKKMPDKSMFYRWQGIDIEHHVRLMDLHNPFLQKFIGTIEQAKGFDTMTLPSAPDVKIVIPSPFLNLLLLNLHILKHSLGWGIGLRQLCDMARAYYKLHDLIDPEELKKAYRRLGLSKWTILLHTFLTRHLGLPEQCLPYPDAAPSAQPLLDIVWRGGNFGFQLAGRDPSGLPTWKHKINTAQSFGRNMRFALSYAPKEAFWTFSGLLRGQF